jgi:hypothetical protein
MLCFFGWHISDLTCLTNIKLKNKTPCSESASELCRLNDRRLSVKLVPTFADRVCSVVRATDLGFLDLNSYFFF